MKITAVEPQKKHPGRFNIFLDGQFGFGADEDLVVEKRLVLGKELSKDDLEKILFEAEVGKLMGRMYSLFNIRQRSEKEVRDYLRNLSFKRKVKEQEEISEIGIESLIEKLKQKGLINDREFALSWTESRRRSKNKGKNVLRAELFQKGIDREIVEEVVSRQSSEVSEEDLARQALEKKLKSWRTLEDNEFKKKATEFLVRRGFEYNLAKEVINDFLQRL
jgi:regulatory protein